jgi:hypothetical protein
MLASRFWQGKGRIDDGAPLEDAPRRGDHPTLAKAWQQRLMHRYRHPPAPWAKARPVGYPAVAGTGRVTCPIASRPQPGLGLAHAPHQHREQLHRDGGAAP